MPHEELESLLRYLKALADQSRLRLLGLLATQERTVDELATLLKLRAPTVSHHLAKLKELDLVSMRTDGTTHLYSLNGSGLGRMNRLLSTPENVAVLARDNEGDTWERKVLQDFMEDGRLKTIPAQERKRLVILRWLARQFEWSRTYPEREVNEVIARYHPDTASLRRELIGHHFMQREHGIYWRTERDGGVPEAVLIRVADALDPSPGYTAAELDALSANIAPDVSPESVRRDLIATNRIWKRGDTYIRRQVDDSVENA